MCLSNRNAVEQGTGEAETRIIVALSLCWMDVNFVYGNNEETLSIQFIIAWSD